MGKKSEHFRVRQRLDARITDIQNQTDAARASMQTADSFVNFSAKLGFGAGSQQDTSRFKLDFISRNPYNLEAAYRSNWVCGMVVDVVAEDMTREGITLSADAIPPDDREKLDKALERLNIWGGFSDGVKWGRLYGGCVGVLLIDGQRLDTPLNLRTVGEGQFKGLIALDRWQVTPSLSDLVTELGPNLGKPRWYDVTAAAQALVGERIHHSRVIRIEGQELPWRQRLAENGWGQSVLERLWDRIVAFDSTSEGAAQLVYKAHLRTLKVKGLRDIIALGGKALQGLVEQVQMTRQYQSNEGMTLLDDSDTFETHQYSFAGLSDMLLQFGQQLSGATQIPLVRLFGQSPAGLNSTGESDLRTYYDNIKKQQDQRIRPGMRIVLECLCRSELGKPWPENGNFEFVSLWQMTDTEKATVAKTTADAVVAAEDAGIISQQTSLKELREVSKKTGVFSHITDEDIEQAETEPPKPDEAPSPEELPIDEPKIKAVQ